MQDYQKSGIIRRMNPDILARSLKILEPEQAAKIILERWQDLTWCQKADDCATEAKGIALIYEDLVYATEEINE